MAMKKLYKFSKKRVSGKAHLYWGENCIFC